MTIKLLYDHIDPEKGPIPNLEPMFGEYLKNYCYPIWTEIENAEILPSYIGADQSNWFYPIYINRPTMHVDDLIISPDQYTNNVHFSRKLSTKIKKGLLENRGWVLFHFYEPMSKEFQDMLAGCIVAGRKETMFTKDIVPYDRFLIINSGNKAHSHKNFLDFPHIDSIRLANLKIKPDKLKQKDRKHFACFNANPWKSKYRGLVKKVLEEKRFSDFGYTSSDENTYLPEDILQLVDINFVVESEQVLDLKNERHCSSLMNMTEKTERNFIYKKPALFYAQPGHLEQIKAKGFKTFSDIFDESYDSIENPEKRLMFLCKELYKWINLSNSQRQELLEKINPVLVHNYNHALYRTSSSFIESSLKKFYRDYNE